MKTTKKMKTTNKMKTYLKEIMLPALFTDLDEIISKQDDIIPVVDALCDAFTPSIALTIIALNLQDYADNLDPANVEQLLFDYNTIVIHITEKLMNKNGDGGFL